MNVIHLYLYPMLIQLSTDINIYFYRKGSLTDICFLFAMLVF